MLCDTNSLGTLNTDDCFGTTQSLCSLIVEFVIGQNAIGELGDNEKCRNHIVVVGFLNWTADGTPAMAV